jgi:hypothetical protein
MKKVCILLMFSSLAISPILAQDDASFSVEISNDSILMGNMFKVVFTLAEGQGNDFQAPRFTGFDVVSGPNVSSSFSMMNGQTNQTVSYTYYLKPIDVGNYYIEPASIAVNGAILETIPKEVTVVPNPDGIIQEPERQANDPFNFRFEMDDFPWPQFPSLEFDIPEFDERPKEAPKKKRKTYKL